MSLEAEILREHSKRQATRIADWIGTDKKRFRQLMELFLHGEYQVTQRSAWSIGICAERHPMLIRPHLKQMVRKIQQPDVHDAAKRNVVRILQYIDIPDELLGIVATTCFNYVSSPNEPIAVRAFSMTVLANIAMRKPGIKNELKLVIEHQLSYGSIGLCARARKVLKLLEYAG